MSKEQAATPKAPRDKRTRAQLVVIITDLSVKLDSETEQRRAGERLVKIAQDGRAEARAQFDDLKTRLHAAELECATMRGYIDRCQEDDQVREELVPTGDIENGPVTMVPKRKHRMFPLVMVGMDPGSPHGDRSAMFRDMRDHFNRGENGVASASREKPKHWVNY